MRFTDRSIAALRPKKARYEVWEDGRTGFGVRVASSGRRSWIFMYRFGGRARRMTIGVYPGMSLADAGVAVAEAKRKLAGGADPGLALVQARRGERQADTVTELVEEYLAKWARPRKRSAHEDERILRKDVVPAWGRKKAKHITRRDIIVLADRIADRAPIMANRTLAVIRRMFAFAVEKDIVDANPARDVRAPAKEVKRDRVLTEAEIRAFWNGLDNARMLELVKLALKLQLATAQRRGEIIEADWSEFELDNAAWTIAADRSKNGLAHVVPLSGLSLRLLSEIRASGGDSQWLFPSPRKLGAPINRGTINHLLSLNQRALGVDDLRTHDLRRSAASHMTALGIPRLTVGKILNHAESGVTAGYDRHLYAAEKRLALEAWGRRLDEIISGRAAPADKVVRLR